MANNRKKANQDSWVNSQEWGKRRDRTRRKKAAAAGLVAVAILCLLALTVGGVYVGMAQRYKTVFFPNTQINGVDASGMTVAEVKELISMGTENYVLQIEEREGRRERIRGEAIGLRTEFNGALEQLLAAQNPYEWGLYQMNLQSGAYTLESMIVYDEERLQTQIGGLVCMDAPAWVEPFNARVSEYVPGQGYTIVPEHGGTILYEDKLRAAIAEAILNLQETLSLEEAGVYKAAEINSENPVLLRQLDEMNRYAGVTVTYQFGEESEVLDGSRIQEWLIPGEDGSVEIDSELISSYVEELAATWNTSNKAKTLKTSYGETIQVRGGSYGWRINQAAEAEELEKIIRSGQSQTREPVYGQVAASRGETDYGDTYVEINLTAQHLFFYKDGELVVESDFVSGNKSRGWGTPPGTYSLAYKQRNAVLEGEDYETPVDYWMPFNGNIGMHDATWRGSFGGTVYLTNGSHGCINLPHSAAKKIFENISEGVPVICYNLEETEEDREASAAPSTGAGTNAASGTAAGTTTGAPPAAAESTAGGVTEPPAETAGGAAAGAPAAAETPTPAAGETPPEAVPQSPTQAAGETPPETVPQTPEPAAGEASEAVQLPATTPAETAADPALNPAEGRIPEETAGTTPEPEGPGSEAGPSGGPASS